MYAIVIVGAGLAGATLARLLGKKYKILIIDKRQLLDMNSKSNIKKCCGGLLAPDAQQMLTRFEFVEQYYQRHYININREKFDKWLVSLIPSEVIVICKTIFKGFEII